MSPAIPGSPESAVADRIKEVRLHLNMTQEDFAELLDVSRSHLSSIETYRVAPSLEAIIGVMLIDLRCHPMRQIDPTWLLLGPKFEPDMFGKVRFLDVAPDDLLHLYADWAQHGRR